MCGITGFVGSEDVKLIKKMTGMLAHRGPDDFGYFYDKDVCMGHRRLSIIDLNSGKQPIHNEDESVWIIFNGEIYNYKKLRFELQKKGHRFYTNSDTETIVHAYEEYGDRCPEKLRGMFAFAIWDCGKKKLLLVRDRMGIKPLYYTVLDGKFIFSSEIKSMLLDGDVKREVDKSSLHEYLTFFYVPGPKTMFRNIYKVLPGNILTYEDGEVKTKRYWELKIPRDEEKNENYYVEMLRNILKESVEMRLMSEVPLGVYLSGGLDSSSIVAFMKEVTDGPIETFSIGFGKDDPVDELSFARSVAEHFETNHHEIVVDQSCVKLLPKITWHLDEPVADPVSIPIYLLSEFSKKRVTVVLSGEGGDEMFGGYRQYRNLMLFKKYGGILREFRHPPMSHALKSLPVAFFDKFFNYPSSMGKKGKERLFETLKGSGDLAGVYLSLISLFTENDKKKLYSDGLLKATASYDITNKTIEDYFHGHGNRMDEILNRIFIRETKTWLPDYILARLDKMTMANATEGRVPLLDHELAEFSIGIPQHLKIKNGVEKYVFRKAVKDMLPKETEQRKKHPFFVPINSWIERDLGELASVILDEKRVEKKRYFKYPYIKDMLGKHQKSRLIYSRQLWALLSFEMWHDMFIENEKIKIPRGL
jgi:asparagine synthase (glutamine-hydrolysing)